MNCKKLFALMLSLCLLLSLCACGTAAPEITVAPETTAAPTEITTVPTTLPVETTEATQPEETTQPAESTITPLVFEVTDQAGNTVWLMGTIHVGYESFYPLPGYVYQVFDQADAVAFEMDIVAFETDLSAQMAALQPLMYTDGTTIADHIPQDLYQKAVQIMTDAGYYNSLLDYYNVTMWWSLLESLMYEELGIDSTLGIDLHLLEKAYQENKPVQEVESAQFQYAMLANFSQPLQLLLLEEAVAAWEDLEASGQSVNELIDIWSTGNEAAMVDYLFEEAEAESEEELALYEEYNKAMSTDRNIGMADFAENALKSGEKVFVCVGAAHVVGPGGIVDLLRTRGYTVTAIGGTPAA